MKKEQRERRENRKKEWVARRRERGVARKMTREVSTFTNDNAIPPQQHWNWNSRGFGGAWKEQRDKRKDRTESDLKTQVKNNLGPKHWTVVVKIIKISKQTNQNLLLVLRVEERKN